MDKEQAIDLLDNLIGMIEDNQDNDYDTAFRMAIEALKAQLSPQGTTKGTTSDLISRKWLLDCINDGWIKFDTDKDANRFIHLVRDIAPTIQPERKKGEWLPDNNNAYEMRFVCSCCKESEVVPTIGFTKYSPLWDFCPNCGADMRGEKDERTD